MPAGELKPPFVSQFSIFLDYLLQQPVEDPNTLLIWICNFYRLTLLHLSHKVKFLNSPPEEYLTPIITTTLPAIEVLDRVLHCQEANKFHWTGWTNDWCKHIHHSTPSIQSPIKGNIKCSLLCVKKLSDSLPCGYLHPEMQPIPAMLTWLSVESSFHFIMIHQHTVSAETQSDISSTNMSSNGKPPWWLLLKMETSLKNLNEYNAKLAHEDWSNKPLHPYKTAKFEDLITPCPECTWSTTLIS